jgi:glycosyltransferase involved in cell wall biosynthesis
VGDAGLQKRLGEAGRHEVIERFSADRMVANTLAVYEELAGPAANAPAQT